MSNTFGFFEDRGAGTGFKLTQIVTSPYESEYTTGSAMVRRLDQFNFGNLPFNFNDGIVESGVVNLLDFKTDNTVGFRFDLSTVELLWEDDEADGRREVIVTAPDFSKSFSWFSVIGTYLRSLYPQGYSAGVN